MNKSTSPFEVGEYSKFLSTQLSKGILREEETSSQQDIAPEMIKMHDVQAQIKDIRMRGIHYESFISYEDPDEEKKHTFQSTGKLPEDE